MLAIAKCLDQYPSMAVIIYLTTVVQLVQTNYLTNKSQFIKEVQAAQDCEVERLNITLYNVYSVMSICCLHSRILVEVALNTWSILFN
jgi:hypothetical protein